MGALHDTLPTQLQLIWDVLKEELMYLEGTEGIYLKYRKLGTEPYHEVMKAKTESESVRLIYVKLDGLIKLVKSLKQVKRENLNACFSDLARGQTHPI